MDQRDDMSYLKRYVQSHPDNRMAWYLLGKQYVLEDKEGKANYCFLQAGSIYEAYERKKHPLASEPKEIIKAWNRKRKFKVLAARSAGAAALLWIVLLANPFAGFMNEDRDESDEDAKTGTISDAQEKQQRLQVVFTKPNMQQPIGSSLGALTVGNSSSAGEGLAVMLEQDGKWRKWTGGTRILLSAKKKGSGEGYDIRMLDARTCTCQPDDATETFRIYKDWSKLQEERWTLTSAITQYEDLFRKWPGKLEDMIRPYPNNVLSVETANMRVMFPELLMRLKTHAAHAAAGSDQDSQEGSSQSGVTPRTAVPGQETQSEGMSLPEAPLSIVVDKETHRLAVISGDVIVRSYAAGLGAERTPGGSFYISEKVKNPNGRDDGEFGSRGMSLSGTRYAIHGTDEPSCIGKDESHGCIRMNKADVEELYDLVPIGTKVEIKSGIIPAPLSPPEDQFHLRPVQDETNPAVVYRWLS
ncbi:L,D-transpeptidase [Paenibacillus solisilvae]|uniref:L,D-transpeptidase n=1 Tax=Paenibacillus solisilvae TaxID=2486751 RepID=A0ABW0W5Q2_9BACL